MANESTYCKLRIAGCAIVMASVTVYFQEYFDGLVFRSSQF